MISQKLWPFCDALGWGNWKTTSQLLPLSREPSIHTPHSQKVTPTIQEVWVEASATVWECLLFFISLGTSVSHFTVGVAKSAPSGSLVGPWQELARRNACRMCANCTVSLEKGSCCLKVFFLEICMQESVHGGQQLNELVSWEILWDYGRIWVSSGYSGMAIPGALSSPYPPLTYIR